MCPIVFGILCVVLGIYAIASGEVGLSIFLFVVGGVMIYSGILILKEEESSSKPKPNPEPPQPVPEPVPPAPKPEPQPNGRVCQHCGAELAEGDVFCIECGRKV